MAIEGAKMSQAALQGTAEMSSPELSIVVPVFNEQEVISLFQSRIEAVLSRIGLSFEIIYVNDGSTDSSLRILEGLAGSRSGVSALNLSRNFGKEIAVTAGLDFALGEAVIVIDADLQDPPELITAFVRYWKDGFDVVYGQRRTRDGETWLKRKTAEYFYDVISRVGDVRVPPNVGDYRLMSRRVVEALKRIREHHRFMKGLFSWVGFPSKAVVYDREPRAAGKTKWNYWRLWNLALEGITSHTVMPLKIASYVGLFVSVVALVLGFALVIDTLIAGNSVPGYPSLMTVILFLGGAQLMGLGIIGEYLGRIFNETKQRPLYLVEHYYTPPERGRS